MRGTTHSRFLRRVPSRLGPLLALFQRSPVAQWLFPETKLIAAAGLGEITKWTAATVAGLGAYDSVSGATSVITQLYPDYGATTVDTAVGASLEFSYMITGNLNTAQSWSVDGEMPPGLVHANSTDRNDDSINGVPTQQGQYTVIVTAWQQANQTGLSKSEPFIINVGPAVITRHPASVTIPSGSTAILTVEATGPGLTYQWFDTASPSTPINGASASTYTTPALTATTTYQVQVTRGTIISLSNPATVTIGAADPFQEWRAAQFNAIELADPTISGPSADPDGDTFSNATEYVFGTTPLTRGPSPLAMSLSGSNVSLSFTAKAASGTGYAGKTRHYALESSTTLGSGAWSSPEGYADITGSGQTVTFSEARPATPKFHRIRVWLTP
ncbi:MAG: hypothetical protein EOP87_09605 [Verrucomicrobiaceae bacterium]|nr:MAG: hypothetical protein EOP87_09605 [Verrucomicrobiaceae bacterium]